MNILFLTLVDFNSIEERGIYTDLLREFVKHNHNVYIVSPVEARKNIDTHLITKDRVTILKQKIGNIQKINVIEKGIATITLENRIINGIKKYFSNVKFDLVLYSTPPITLCSAIEYVKKRDNAKTYLMLKDIFPQNAVDLGMLSKSGIKGLIYKYFRNKEKKLYEISDRIGCMSQANVDYVLKHNPEVVPEKVEICPNAIEVIDMRLSEDDKIKMRQKYQIPLDKKVFVYGGNLGKPQGISFLVECLKSQLDKEDAFFLIVGSGTEFYVLDKFFNEYKPSNMRLMKSLPKEDYDRMIAACDIGMIFLDYRFTIPNFPSRLLSYMQAGLPVLACTDKNTDIGKVIAEGGFGWWCESREVDQFSKLVYSIIGNNKSGENSVLYLRNNFDVKKVYKFIFGDLSNEGIND